MPQDSVIQVQKTQLKLDKVYLYNKSYHIYVQYIILFKLTICQSYNLGLTDLTARFVLQKYNSSLCKDKLINNFMCIFSLMWIGKNIEHFGGDPSLVTLLGWGAGADLVTALTATRLYPVIYDEPEDATN